MQWHNNWIVIPGPNGQAAGTVLFSGGLVFDPTKYDSDSKAFPTEIYQLRDII